MEIKAVIFDMDGVIVNNHEYHFKAWMEFAEKYEFHLDADIYRDQFNGKTNKDIFEMIFEDLNPEQIAEFSKEKEAMYRELYDSEMATTPGLLDFLASLKRNRIKIGLATSAPPENVDFILDGLQLRPEFDVIVDGTEVDRGKPDPEIYQIAMTKLNVNPKNCIVFEDSIAGIEAGTEAGCKVVGLATSHEVWEIQDKTEHIIYDFTEVKAVWDRISR